VPATGIFTLVRDQQNTALLRLSLFGGPRPLASEEHLLATIALQPVESMTVTTLVDNSIDMFMPDQGPAKRLGPMSDNGRCPAALLEEGEVYEHPRAEHGFSALVSVTTTKRTCQVLFDAGRTPDGLAHNLGYLGIKPDTIETVILSHGHFDHTTGLDGFSRILGRTNLPVIIHPDFWNQRRLNLPGYEPWELPTTSKSALQGVGFEIIEDRQPSFLLDGSVLVTGEVDRTNDYEPGFPMQEVLRNGRWFDDPLVLDDQALVVHVRDKGLVVMTGCGHAGVVNTVSYAQRLTGIEGVHAIIGGFHLNGPLFEPLIPRVCAAFKQFAPNVIVPTHCTGWRATHALAAAFPDAFIPNSVGSRFEL
jgi:7,8-dihydropterin-6-yl-methyl-4-(beta-D-ribofuranosyl)aminobenzene 5'-phosphate synthase